MEMPIELAFQLEEIAKEIRKILKINPDEIIELQDFMDKVKENFDFSFKKSKDNYLSINNDILTIAYDYYSDESTYYRDQFIIKAFCYTILNKEKLKNNCVLGENTINHDKYVEYLTHSILLPEKLYRKEMIYTSKVDGYANIEGMAKKFKVKEYSILSRGRDLHIWN